MDEARKRELRRAYREKERRSARAAMILSQEELNELLEYLDCELLERSCDHSLAMTMAWATEHGIDREELVSSLGHFGGYCDCEVLLNLGAAAEDIFKP